MAKSLSQQINAAAHIVKEGGVIAYPTEGVFGLGCDPFNEAAVKKILSLKKRAVSKGVIVIAASWQQVQSMVQPFAGLEKLVATWPENTTYLFPASDQTPAWVKGDHVAVAIRVSQYSLVKKLCVQAGPLVSTSANVQGEPSLVTAAEVQEQFSTQVDFILSGAVDDAGKSSTIICAQTGQVIRQ